MKMQRLDKLTLESYLLAELPGEDLRAVEFALAEDPGLRAGLESIRESNRLILEDYPAEYVENLVRKKMGGKNKYLEAEKIKVSFFMKPLFAAALVAVTAGTALLFNYESNLTKGDHIILKGDAAKLFVFRKGVAGPEPLDEKSAVRENDEIQIAFRVPAGYCACVISVDSRGVATVHYPSQGAAPLTSGKEIFLPNSYQLDDAPGNEIFYLAASKKLFKIEDIKKLAVASAKTLSPLNLEDGFAEAVFVLSKGDK